LLMKEITDFAIQKKPEREPWKILRPKIVAVQFGKSNMTKLVESLVQITGDSIEQPSQVQKAFNVAVSQHESDFTRKQPCNPPSFCI